MHGPRVRRSSVVSDPEGALEVMQRQTFILKKLIKHCLVSWEVSQPRNSIIRGEQCSDHVSEGRWPPRYNHTSSRDHWARSQCSPCSERGVRHMHSALISQLLRWQSPGSQKKKKIIHLTEHLLLDNHMLARHRCHCTSPAQTVITQTLTQGYSSVCQTAGKKGRWLLHFQHYCLLSSEMQHIIKHHWLHRL